MIKQEVLLSVLATEKNVGSSARNKNVVESLGKCKSRAASFIYIHMAAEHKLRKQNESACGIDAVWSHSED